MEAAVRFLASGRDFAPLFFLALRDSTLHLQHFAALHMPGTPEYFVLQSANYRAATSWRPQQGCKLPSGSPCDSKFCSKGSSLAGWLVHLSCCTQETRLSAAEGRGLSCSTSGINGCCMDTSRHTTLLGCDPKAAREEWVLKATPKHAFNWRISLTAAAVVEELPSVWGCPRLGFHDCYFATPLPVYRTRLSLPPWAFVHQQTACL